MIASGKIWWARKWSRRRIEEKHMLSGQERKTNQLINSKPITALKPARFDHRPHWPGCQQGILVLRQKGHIVKGLHFFWPQRLKDKNSYDPVWTCWASSPCTTLGAVKGLRIFELLPTKKHRSPVAQMRLKCQKQTLARRSSTPCVCVCVFVCFSVPYLRSWACAHIHAFQLPVSWFQQLSPTRLGLLSQRRTAWRLSVHTDLGQTRWALTNPWKQSDPVLSFSRHPRSTLAKPSFLRLWQVNTSIWIKDDQRSSSSIFFQYVPIFLPFSSLTCL